eukprot:370549_1
MYIMAKFLLISFVLSVLVNVMFGASTSLTTSIDDCIGFVSVQLATDALTDWVKDTTHATDTNHQGSIWRVGAHNKCDGPLHCINLSGPGEDTGSYGKDVWIEQTLDVSMVKGQDITIAIHGWTKSMNSAGEHAWVRIGCDDTMDAEFGFYGGVIECAEFATCSVIENSNCDTLTVRIGGELGAYADDIFVTEVYIQYNGLTHAPTSMTTMPTSSTSFPTLNTIAPTSAPTTEPPTLSPTTNPTTPSLHPTTNTIPPTLQTLFPTASPTMNPTTLPTTNPTSEVIETTPIHTQSNGNIPPKQSENNVFWIMVFGIMIAVLLCLILSIIGLICLLKRGKQYKGSMNAMDEVGLAKKQELGKMDIIAATVHIAIPSLPVHVPNSGNEGAIPDVEIQGNEECMTKGTIHVILKMMSLSSKAMMKSMIHIRISLIRINDKND